MAANRLCFLGLLVLFILLDHASPSRISDAVHGSTARSLLQTATDCPIDFENQNYTIITSQCRGPKFAPESCCSAFKEFACPFIDEIDDLTTTCASTMFSYISLYGKYPPGLFAFECREGKLGLDCLNVSSYIAANSPIKNHSDKIVVERGDQVKARVKHLACMSVKSSMAEYKVVKKVAKQAVAEAKDKAFEHLYKVLDEKGEECLLYHVAKDRHVKSKNLDRVKCIKNENGQVLVDDDLIKER